MSDPSRTGISSGGGARALSLAGIACWFAAGLVGGGALAAAHHAWTGGGEGAPRTEAGREIVLGQHLHRARDFLAGEHFEEAVSELMNAAELAPADPRPYRHLAMAYEKVRLHERAEEAYRKVLELAPRDLDANMKLAKLLYKLGKSEEAGALVREYEIALGQHLDQARRFLASERLGDAVRELTRAVELAPDDPRPYRQLAVAYERLRLHERAEQAYRRLLDLAPRDLDAKLSFAKYLHDLGKTEEAVALLEEYEKERPDDPLLWAELAINALRLGGTEEAIRLLERYTRAREKDPWGHANLGRAYAAANRHDEAERSLREAIALDPQMADARLWLAQTLIAGGRRTEADAELARFRNLRRLQTEKHQLETRLSRNPGDINVLVPLSRVRFALGQHEGAMRALEIALEIAPEDRRLHVLRAELTRAIEQARRAQQAPAR